MGALVLRALLSGVYTTAGSGKLQFKATKQRFSGLGCRCRGRAGPSQPGPVSERCATSATQTAYYLDLGSTVHIIDDP